MDSMIPPPAPNVTPHFALGARTLELRSFLRCLHQGPQKLEAFRRVDPQGFNPQGSRAAGERRQLDQALSIEGPLHGMDQDLASESRRRRHPGRQVPKAGSQTRSSRQRPFALGPGFHGHLTRVFHPLKIRHARPPVPGISIGYNPMDCLDWGFVTIILACRANQNSKTARKPRFHVAQPCGDRLLPRSIPFFRFWAWPPAG